MLPFPGQHRAHEVVVVLPDQVERVAVLQDREALVVRIAAIAPGDDVLAALVDRACRIDPERHRSGRAARGQFSRKAVHPHEVRAVEGDRVLVVAIAIDRVVDRRSRTAGHAVLGVAVEIEMGDQSVGRSGCRGDRVLVDAVRRQHKRRNRRRRVVHIGDRYRDALGGVAAVSVRHLHVHRIDIVAGDRAAHILRVLEVGGRHEAERAGGGVNLEAGEVGAVRVEDRIGRRAAVDVAGGHGRDRGGILFDGDGGGGAAAVRRNFRRVVDGDDVNGDCAGGDLDSTRTLGVLRTGVRTLSWGIAVTKCVAYLHRRRRCIVHIDVCELPQDVIDRVRSGVSIERDVQCAPAVGERTDVYCVKHNLVAGGEGKRAGAAEQVFCIGAANAR